MSNDCVNVSLHVPGVRRGVAAHALDPALAGRLRTLSESLLAEAGY